jgi:hypothetical protein
LRAFETFGHLIVSQPLTLNLPVADISPGIARLKEGRKVCPVDTHVDTHVDTPVDTHVDAVAGTSLNVAAPACVTAP